jgi:hypothetical protein
MSMSPLTAVEILTQLLAGVVMLLVLGAGAVRARRRRRQARRRRTEAVVRPIILRALDESAGGTTPPRLSRSAGRLLDSMAATMVTRVRGADREALVALLMRRGTIGAALWASRSRRAVKRLRAVELLGAVGVADGVPALIARLGDRNPDVRRAAVRAVGRTGAVEAVPHLLELAGRADCGVSQHSVTLALLRLGPAAAPALTTALAAQDGGYRARTAAARVLGWLGHLGAVEALCATLEGQAREVQLAALDALGRIGSPAAAATLAARLEPCHPAEVRVVAARALGRLGDPSASAVLGSLLGQEHDVARAAATALAQLGGPGHGSLAEAAIVIPEAREAVALTAIGGRRPGGGRGPARQGAG